jgi:putative transposase
MKLSKVCYRRSPTLKKMPNYKRAYVNGGIYFFTVVTHHRVPVFCDDEKCAYLKRCFNDIARLYPFDTEAIVVLPDHIHTIWTLPENDDDFSNRWMLVKKQFSTHYSGMNTRLINHSMSKKREQGIWQRRFWEHLIRNEEDFQLHCDYIHYNPVKHGLVSSPGLWEHSSFKQFVKKGYYPSNWGMMEPLKLHNTNYE